MKLYFSPLACSLAARICLYEAGATAQFVEVDPAAKTTDSGTDFWAVNPLGMVPVIEFEDGTRLTENIAILDALAQRFPALGTTGASSRTALLRWLAFISTELHKVIYVPLLDKHAATAVKQYSVEKAERRLAWLASQLEGRDYLLETFSVADAYLFTVLNWSLVTPVALERWPALVRYVERVRARPAVSQAFEEEKRLYIRELQRHGEPLPKVSAAV